MRRFQKWQKAGALLLFALAYFFDGSGVVAAVLPAVAVHELGHLLALWAAGAQVRDIRVGLLGLEINYRGRLGQSARLGSALAGPGAGALYAALLLAADNPFWRLSGQLSAGLTAFNLLPALPLDGGRVAAEFLAGQNMRRLSRLTALLLLILGLWVLWRFSSFMLLIAGAWLLLYNLS